MKTVSKGADIPAPFLKDKLCIPIVGGFIFILPRHIIMIEGASDMCRIFLEGKVQPLLAGLTLKEISVKLDPRWFIRVHKSYIINKKHVESYHKKDGDYLLMKDERRADVSSPNSKNIEAAIKAMKGN